MIQFNLCNQGVNLEDTKFKKDNMKVGKTCKNNQHAYIGAASSASKNASAYTCKYSFAEPEAVGVSDGGKKGKFMGYDLKFASSELKSDKKTP